MKQGIFDKIMGYLSGLVRRLSHHTYGCCGKIAKNCSNCKYVTDKEHYAWDGTMFVEVDK